MGRLIMAIISTIVEETALVAIVLWALPQINVNIPTAGLVALMVAWGAYSVTTYRIASRALKRKQLVGLPDMVGGKGKVVSPLAPEGMVRIRGELWIATSASGEMESGRQIVVVAQNSLKLVVRQSTTADDREKVE